MVTFVGRPAATVGAVYVAVSSPVETIVPPFGVVTDQVTPVLLVLVTVAENDAV